MDPVILNSEQIYERYKIHPRILRRKVEQDGFPAYQERPGGKWYVSRHRGDKWAEYAGNPIDKMVKPAPQKRRGRPKKQAN